MKYKMIAILVFSIFTTTAFSQSRLDKMKATPASKMAAKLTSMLQEKLSLTDAQVEKVSPIYLEDAKKKKVLMEDFSIFTVRGKMKKINKATASKLKGILTSEQMQRYEDSVEAEIQKEFKAWIDDQNII
ncbi:hypothetical protein [Kordia jejudonensis]|uniref:hypothetical protein n=1 Tax=Kordia jejudonensis TaxID=1348245 RepID=UPI000629C9E4|nr:hypothetical protein [Kordia jejudonensis]